MPGGPPPEKFCVFDLPILDFLQFQHDFRSFSDINGLLLGGPKPFTGGGGGGGYTGARGGGGFGVYVKKGPDCSLK